MAPLPKRRLGKAGPEITRVGFGAWAIGGSGYAFGRGPQDAAASLAALRHAVERGINWIDTAAASLEFSRAELDEIAAALGRTGAGAGPREP